MITILKRTPFTSVSRVTVANPNILMTSSKESPQKKHVYRISPAKPSLKGARKLKVN